MSLIRLYLASSVMKLSLPFIPDFYNNKFLHYNFKYGNFTDFQTLIIVKQLGLETFMVLKLYMAVVLLSFCPPLPTLIHTIW